MPEPSAAACAVAQDGIACAYPCELLPLPLPDSKSSRSFTIAVIVRGGEVLSTGSADLSHATTMDLREDVTVHGGTTILSIKESLLHHFNRPASACAASNAVATQGVLSATDLRLSKRWSGQELWDGSPNQLPACETAICDFAVNERDELVLGLA